MPVGKAKAGFFSDLFSNDASANTNVTTESAETNSQTLGLLQANVSSAAVIQDKKDKNSKDKANTSDDTDTSTISSDNALVPATGPAGVSDGTDNTDTSSDDVSVYVVHQGDDIKTIADMFGVTPNTILWTNGMKKGDKITKDQVLLILPVSGVEITVAKGQTLKSIAKKYNADVNDITSFNGISPDSQLAVGDVLIIPDGTMSDEGGDKPVKNSNTKKTNYYDTHKYANISGYFMNPMPGARLTQGLHDHGESIDLAAPKGTPVLAAAAGTVLFANYGGNGGYGNMIIISHSNGTKTLYGHLSSIVTSVGAIVSQGDIIGKEGSTGHSTGPHLHFRVEGAQNPGAYLKVGSNISASWK